MKRPSEDAAERWSRSGVADHWDAPIPLHQRVRPFPIEAAFPRGTELVRDYCLAAAEAFQVPPDTPVMLIAAATGLAMSQKVAVRLGNEWVQPPNQYNGVLMESANRKTGPFHEATGPITEWERDEGVRLAPMIAEENAAIEIMRRKAERLKDLAAGKATPRKGSKEPTGLDAQRAAVELEQELAEKKPLSPPQLIASDITPEDLARVMAANGERIGIFSDESEAIEILLGRYSDQPNFLLYNKAYDGSTHRVNRVSRTPIILNRPLMSVGLVIQPEGIRDLLRNRKARGTGLVARFAFAMPQSLLGSRKTNPAAIPPALRTGWRHTIRGLLDMPPPGDRGPLEVRLSAEAQSVFDDFCARVEPDLGWCGEFADFGMQAWGGKLCGRIGRIALVLHGLRDGFGGGPDGLISKETIVAAIAWAPYLIDHARAVMGWIGVDEEAVGARRVLAWIVRSSRAHFSKQECFTSVRNTSIQVADDVDRPLQMLCDLRYLRRLPDPAERGRGRPPSPEFIVNPTWDRRSL